MVKSDSFLEHGGAFLQENATLFLHRMKIDTAVLKVDAVLCILKEM